MSTNRIVNALSYLSIVFAPFIFPLIVWIVSDNNPDMHSTARHALILHLIPLVLTILTILVVGISGVISEKAAFAGFLFLALIALVILVDLAMFIYNLYLGIKILVQD
ncbi:DUF4870 domain-containing protein [Lentilactobacillus buchneri]|uniref:DUF4870 domain-containing protein n=2 Tax=Lentilactobacillus buchneri TaxID=1581 RepID=J9W6T6_LENBU|nr:DUF4870 domain-containing protein [Lentilactobacillus buchneri]MCC6102127.1 DUF4870 domain-containing protein [Lactobacillus sp.]WCJ51518.1 DUF4870 domain-containing protein [Lentilactobacillus sp. Egmn17]AFR99905.1 hypothetical protein LBUCD034_0855 [Lentilactobacillus buchneri subsp. silagei CD034]KRK67119.1 integral membrane protein [Lentilactobacillus buchneri DSM 20057]MCT2883334.1 hypothetical protein [Lentilactobacillus buchneri]